MKDKVIELLSKDENIADLLEEFQNDFQSAYYKLNEIERKNILKFRDAIFRLWLYSPIIDDTYLTPNYLVNNIAQQNYEGDYIVIPHIKYNVHEDGALEFEIRWIYYSFDNNPVIEDIERLVNHAIPSLIVRDENIYVVDDGEELIERLNFRSRYYIDYLIGLSVNLGILKKMKAIGCKAYQISNGYDNYNKLNNSDKLKLIVKNSINIANKNIKEQKNLAIVLYGNNNDFVKELLNHGVGENEYYKYIDELAIDVNNFLGNLDTFMEDKRVIKELNSMTYVFGEELAEQLVIEELGIFVDMFFTSIFGYYLGVVTPVYEGILLIDSLVNFLKDSVEELQTLGYIFRLELGHDLTPLGERIIKDYRKEFKEKNFSSFNLSELKGIIARYKIEKRAILEGVNNIKLFDKLGDSNDFRKGMIEEPEYELTSEISNHLDEFFDYLKNTKKLKEVTCEKSVSNIGIFVVAFLGLEEEKELDTIEVDDVEEYLGDWFITKVATSKNSIKEQISAINQYAKFLELKGHINKETAKSIKDNTKDKDKYFDKLSRFFEDGSMPF